MPGLTVYADAQSPAIRLLCSMCALASHVCCCFVVTMHLVSELVVMTKLITNSQTRP